MIIDVEKIMNKLEAKVDPKIQECLDFVKLQRNICNDAGYSSYSRTPYKVGSLFKYEEKVNEYFLLLSITGNSIDVKNIGYYHGIAIKLNERTNTWEIIDNALKHSVNDMTKDRKILVSTEGDKYLEEEIFSINKNTKNIVFKIVEEIESQINTQFTAFKILKDKFQGGK